MRRKSGRRSSPEKTESSRKVQRQTVRKHKRSSSRSSVDSDDDKIENKKSIQEGVNHNSSEEDRATNTTENKKEMTHSATDNDNSELKSGGDDKVFENRSFNSVSSLIKNIEESEDLEKETEEKEEKKNKGKSKGKNKSNIEQSSNIIEPEIEPENVQGTPQSPSNDNADDNENVQNVNDATKKDVKHSEENINTQMETEGTSNTVELDVKFESEYVQPNVDVADLPASIDDQQERVNKLNVDTLQKSEDNMSHLRNSPDTENNLNKQERSLTPDITLKKSESVIKANTSSTTSFEHNDQEKIDGSEATKKKITLRRSPPQNKEADKIDGNILDKETNKKIEEQEEKPRKKITLKRNNVDERANNEDNSNLNVSDNSIRRSLSNDEGEKKRRLSSFCEEKGQEGEERPKKSLKKVNLIRSWSRVIDDDHEEKAKLLSTERRHMWSRSDWLDNLTFYNIDVDSIKIVCPSLTFLGEDEIHLESVPRERKKSESELKRKMSMDKSDDSDRPDYEKQTSEESLGEQKIELNPNIIALNRKISIVDDTASKLKPPPSPAKHPVSDVLFITNLVRPFTVKQLKELLERTGKIMPDGFWTDRIKSKCYVHYESIEEAEATRNALHGVHWPIGNGKQLVIDYATVEDLEKAKNPAPAPKPIADKVPEKENREPAKTEDKYKDREKEEREERKRRDGPVREWDMGKEEIRRGRSRSRSRERTRKHSRRSYTPEITDYIHRKQRKVEEPVPQKLMDDLFLKTKATPSIYWQPLSPEEIATKQKQRLVRMEEHKRRIEETRARLRDNRRGSFRRR